MTNVQLEELLNQLELINSVSLVLSVAASSDCQVKLYERDIENLATIINDGLTDAIDHIKEAMNA